MLTREQNDLLCRVEGSAPMGGIMRRHWLPVCLSEEVAEKDGQRVKIGQKVHFQLEGINQSYDATISRINDG